MINDIKGNILKPGIVHLSILVFIFFGLNSFCANVLIPARNSPGRIITNIKSPDTLISDDDCNLSVTVIDSSMIFIAELTDFDVFAINKIELCREGDPEALFVMALLASGNVTSMGQYREYARKLDKYIRLIENNDTISDPFLRAKNIYSGIHTYFFKSYDGSNTHLSYDFDQSQLSGIFSSGLYNCISSSLLTISVFARLGYHVKGVLIPYHSYIQLMLNDSVKIDIETTNIEGFDSQYSEIKFNRLCHYLYDNLDIELKPDDFQKKQLVDPYELIAANMNCQHLDSDAIDQSVVNKLVQVRAILNPESHEAQKDLIILYHNTFVDLVDVGCSTIAISFVNVIIPVINRIAFYIHNPEVLNYLSSLYNDYAHSYYLGATLEQDHQTTKTLLDSSIVWLDRSYDAITNNDTLAGITNENNIIMLNNILDRYQEIGEYEKCNMLLSKYSTFWSQFEFCRINNCYIFGNWGGDLADNQLWEEAIEKFTFSLNCLDDFTSEPEIVEYQNALRYSIASSFNGWGIDLLDAREYEASINRLESAIVWCDDVSKKKDFQENLLIAYINWVTYLCNISNYNDAFVVYMTAVEKFSSHTEFSEEIDFLRNLMRECR
jgi:hypothetical protein